TNTIKLAQRGVVTLPKSLRDAYGLKTGDLLTILDLGGVFVLSPRSSEIDALADRIKKTLEEKDESLESMLQVLREEREGYET
ncbi:MAG: AbrB/MazE/SpoVT family DNA-binding domain-containing protein, partial [Anaerolineales bacterium]|nr:AbrB/MazE/SpoVT family DNA-binding domain-containing protein [Anaerolineales bacterium]